MVLTSSSHRLASALMGKIAVTTNVCTMKLVEPAVMDQIPELGLAGLMSITSSIMSLDLADGQTSLIFVQENSQVFFVKTEDLAFAGYQPQASYVLYAK